MVHEISKPDQKTYFITYENNEVFGYGSIEIDQVLTSGMTNIWYSLIEQEWLDKLLNDFNVNPYAVIENTGKKNYGING